MSYIDKKDVVKIEQSEYILNHPAYKYALDVANGDSPAGEYVVKECKKFLNNLEDEDCKYFLNEDDLQLIDEFLKLVKMPDGHRVGMTAYDSLAPFQWYFLANTLGWKYKSNPNKRRYQKSVLLIGRKNGKTFLIGLIFILLLLMEPDFSEFYSVAPDKQLSTIVKQEMGKMIMVSPDLADAFEVLQSQIRCTATTSKMIPLANSDNRLDGRKANVFVADEVGALKNSGPIQSMESSQINMTNKLGVLISTAYQTTENAMTAEVDYCEKVLDDIVEDESLFSLIYKPTNPKEWFEDKAILEANPLMQVIEENYIDLKKMRDKAVITPSERGNYLTKHLNIFIDGDVAEQFVTIDQLREGRLKENEINWKGKEVYVGVDMSTTNDNTSIAMVHYDAETQTFYNKSWAFLPTDRAQEKTVTERLNYFDMRDNGWALFCGEGIIDYRFVEDFVLSLPEKYGVIIKGIGYDRHNAISSANRWSQEGNIETTVIGQNGNTLHSTNKKIKESILSGKWLYEPNDLMEINFKNVRVVYDSNMKSFLNKKRSIGKIDMVVSLLNATNLWVADLELGNVKSVYTRRGLISF